jgi:hypothetical protein
MKLLPLVGAATAAISAASSSSSSIAAVVASSQLSRRTSTRTLNDADGNTYAYLESLSGYALKYSHCVRVKILQEYDDDSVEGNVNFYNGRYHAQYSIYATFQVCGDGNYYDSSSQCSACDYDVEYAAPMDDYLKTSLEYWQRECENDGSSSSCTAFGNDNDDDESQYTECVAAFQEDGMQLYYGPQCGDDGGIVIGVFYDNECTIKTKHESPSLDYLKFGVVQSGCVDCSSDQGQNTCKNLYGEAYHCMSGTDQRGQNDQMSVCSTVKKATTSVDYSGVKKRHAGADLFVKVFLALLTLSLIGMFLFLSYAYYYRHKLAERDRMETDQQISDADYNMDGYGGGGGGERPMGHGGSQTLKKKLLLPTKSALFFVG